MKLLIRKYLKGNTSKLEEQKIYNWFSEDVNNINLFKEEVTLYNLNATDKTFDAQAAFEIFINNVKPKEVKQLNNYLNSKKRNNLPLKSKGIENFYS